MLNDCGEVKRFSRWGTITLWSWLYTTGKCGVVHFSWVNGTLRELFQYNCFKFLKSRGKNGNNKNNPKISNSLYSTLLREHYVVSKYSKCKDCVTTQKMSDVMLAGECMRV